MINKFVTTDYIYKYTVIESNVDADLVTKFIIKAQELNIRESLGSNLYNILLNECPNFTGIHKILIKDYIQPCLAEWTVYHSLPFINFRLTNKSVSQKSSDNSQPSTVDDLKWLQSQVRINAEHYKKQIEYFIKNNIEYFPEYYNSDPKNPFGEKANNEYFSGIYTKNKCKCNIKQQPKSNIDPDINCY